MKDAPENPQIQFARFASTDVQMYELLHELLSVLHAVGVFVKGGYRRPPHITRHPRESEEAGVGQGADTGRHGRPGSMACGSLKQDCRDHIALGAVVATRDLLHEFTEEGTRFLIFVGICSGSRLLWIVPE